MYANYTHTKGRIKVIGYSESPATEFGVSSVKVKSRKEFEKGIKTSADRKEIKLSPIIKGWDYSKLNEDDYKLFLEYVSDEKWKQAFMLHNYLKLSNEKYCCTRHIVKLKKGIKNYANNIGR